MKNKKPNMIMILDGFGLNTSDYGNAIKAAQTPNLDEIFEKYPHISLDASGLAVGLPGGQMGNSEVGHLNIGAGRIVFQELTKITEAINDGIFFNNIPLLDAMERGKDNALHIMGLLSDGGVHSHTNHIKAVLQMAKDKGVKNVYLHCFMDGRDVPPTSGLGFIEEMSAYLEQLGSGKIGVVSGRYYAMDRDKRWDRVKLAYDALTQGKGLAVSSAIEGMKRSYENEVTDEFVEPMVCKDYPGMSDEDAIVFCNFRPDRAREITRALVDPAFDGFTREKTLANPLFVCMTQYDATMPNVKIAFPPHNTENTLGEYISKLGLHQLRIAETEKYAHVTFFFNGGVETPNPLEDRILVPSPKVATYDLQPEMSAFEVAEKTVEEVKSGKYDVIILNFANPDMVGHTGVFDAAVKAIEAVDQCVGKVVASVLDAGGQILLTADHGNADNMLDEDGNVVTAHSTNSVPLVHISSEPAEFTAEKGKLADIAPTLLHLMGLEIPPQMDGKCLVK